MKICADDIYSVDEAGLFYRDTPDGSLSYKHATRSGSKKAMDCVRTLCCSNMSENDKWNVLVIGKRAKPPCLMGIGMDSLPVLYYANKNAWIISEICKKWLMS
jgi:hypothetical protein